MPTLSAAVLVAATFAGASSAQPISFNSLGAIEGADPITGDACVSGVRVDDDSFEDGFKVPGGGTNATFVQRLQPTAHPALLTKACICWRASSGAAGTVPFNLVVYADGDIIPGALLGSKAVQSGVVTDGFSAFTGFACTDLDIQIEQGGLYIGVNWDMLANVDFYACGDTTAAQAMIFSSKNSGSSWRTGTTDWPQLRALGIRAEFEEVPQGDCIPGDTTLCLRDGRFKVEMNWQAANGQGGAARVRDFDSNQTGIFYFNNPDNAEVLVKVLNGCALNDAYWVFFAATTTVEFTLTVTDTQTGTVKEYTNPQGQPANAVTDTAAFATCP